ncbi:hypothetical protein [Streptomyces rhizosphaericus]|uniref:Uncharacterized protein n=1 Tax=Streptomyces rhizosphaericus TaxID=114699 RepID=A0A6G4AIT7_9ACTN|nr:hypothetical protein [Streptomyces rhizosphaericus]NEW72609.1 hypothetical protein [Streptomyces rhizosphaericus]
MSYDLAVWHGDMPSDDREAARVHNRLYDEYLDGDELFPVASAIADFLAALTERWPDRDTGDDTPWASTPLSEGASGPYVYITLAWSSADTASAYVAQIANRSGLVCFDPQMKALRSD